MTSTVSTSNTMFTYLSNWKNISDNEVAQVKQMIRMMCSSYYVDLPEAFHMGCLRIPKNPELETVGYEILLLSKHEENTRTLARLKIDKDGNLRFLANLNNGVKVNNRELAIQSDERVPFPAALDNRYLIHCEESGKPYIHDERTQEDKPLDVNYSKMVNGERFDCGNYNYVCWNPTVSKYDKIIRFPQFDTFYNGNQWLAMFLFNDAHGVNAIPCIVCPELAKMRVVHFMENYDYPYSYSFRQSKEGTYGLDVYTEVDEPDENVVMSTYSSDMITSNDIHQNRTGWSTIPLDHTYFEPHFDEEPRQSIMDMTSV